MTTPVVRTITITDQGMGVADNIEAVRLQAIHRLETLLSEWFLDVYEGVPRDLIFSNSLSLGQIAAILTEEIRKVRHVVSVTTTRIELDRENRVFTYAATLETDFNESTTVEVTT